MAKPKGQDMIDWCAAWDAADHTDKLALCAIAGIQYETARHWRSDSEVPTVENGSVEQPPRSTLTTEELLETKPSVNLDFVTFDIETSNLKADFSVLMSAVIKPFGKEPIVFRGDDYPEWKNQRADDSGLVKDIAKELKKHAIVITHYGQRFDIPFLRAKMVKYGLEPLPQMFGIDSWRIAKNNFQVSSRRLQNLVRFFDIGEKEGVDGALWMEAAYNGDRKAMDAIVEHNIQDVLVLEKLACLTFSYLRSIPKL